MMINGVSNETFKRFCHTHRVAFAALFGRRASGQTDSQRLMCHEVDLIPM